MFQKFYEDTLFGRFVKKLLRDTSLPIVPAVAERDYVLDGACYLYKDHIIKVTGSGPLVETQISIIDKYDSNNRQHSYNYHSKVTYYDPDTHKHLGKYLRYLKTTTNLNLLPYYNCYSGQVITHLSIDSNYSISIKTSNSSKILLVPIRYGQIYTIALNCDIPFIIRPIIYNANCGSQYTLKYSEGLKQEGRLYSGSDFNHPFLYQITATAPLDYHHEDNLYLAIQLPLDNTSGLVVLEGNYIDSWIPSITSAESPDWDYFKNLTLLHFDSNAAIAFSDRLCEYLLLSVINKNETIEGNLEYVQELLNIEKPLGYWPNNLRKIIQKEVEDQLKSYLLRDQDGYLNMELESILLQTGKE